MLLSRHAVGVFCNAGLVVLRVITCLPRFVCLFLCLLVVVVLFFFCRVEIFNVDSLSSTPFFQDTIFILCWLNISVLNNGSKGCVCVCVCVCVVQCKREKKTKKKRMKER